LEFLGWGIMAYAIGCLVMVIILIAGVVSGALFFTSTAVLYYDKEIQPGIFSCHYFTGTGTITNLSFVETGCKRFIAMSGATQP
jgi:hypothetical protein